MAEADVTIKQEPVEAVDLESSTTFAVVEFVEEREPVEEKDIKVVPVNWLEGDAKCMWPKYKSAEKTRKAVLLKQEPNDTFCTHPCQIISRGVSYEEARLSLAEVASQLVGDLHKPTPSKRPRISYHPRYTVCASSSENRSFPQLRSPPPLRPRPSDNRNKCHHATPKLSVSETSRRENCSSWPLSEGGAANKPHSGSYEGQGDATIAHFQETVLCLLTEMRDELRSQKEMLRQLQSVVGLTDPLDSLPDGIQLPIDTMQQFQDVEGRLEDDGIQRNLVAHLSLLGGGSLMETVRRMMQTAMTNSLACNWNWAGRGNKFSFQATRLQGIMFRALRNSPSGKVATQAEFANVVKKWLRYAPDRDGGRARRSYPQAVIIQLCQQIPKGITDQVIQNDMPQFDAQQRVMAINRLLSTGRIDLLKSGSQLIYRLKNAEAASKVKGAGSHEKLVYQIIEEAGNKGIWIRDIRYKCNLLLTEVNKILKNLESKKLIKAVKSVSASKKKVYMLFNVEPDRSVTGGAWYSDQDFESEFVEVLNQQCFKFLEQKATAAREAKTNPMAQKNAAYASSAEIWKYINELGISKVQLSVEDIEMILDTLIYDGKVERSIVAGGGGDAGGQMKLYRATPHITQPTGLMRTPCGVCPVFHECHAGGIISPTNCVYMKEWLEY
ncbi:DNA-directed RNA polymerase III subunit RPC6 [Lamellibrachia satsuma]|nr:DNA-directed RNA polymerase III subunit RPC6 [Lamellibrachia satsuma]